LTLRRILSFVAVVLPRPAKFWLYRRFFGYSIDPTARIGLTLFLDVQHLEVGPDAVIGNFNTVRSVRLVHLGREAGIGTSNRIHGVLVRGDDTTRDPVLYLDDNAVITERHIIEAWDTVRLEKHAWIGGYRCTVLTHSPLPDDEEALSAEGVTVGERSFVLTNCVLVRGAVLPDHSWLLPNSVLVRGETESYTMYGGSPARSLRKLDPEAPVFRRTSSKWSLDSPDHKDFR
jgi:acetyltransferase-like isoleucine patch superfamily enzyme